MNRAVSLFAASIFAATSLAAFQQTDEPVTFRSDVSLVRIDVQIVDGTRPVAGLNAEDFVLRENGRQREIKNFATEKMPLDVLFLLDVSASMRPHVQRIASAAHQALQVLTENDRVAIMVFDRSTRVRLPFRNSKEDVEHEFDNLLRREGFRGGTDITLGMMDAADYVRQNARRDARRAIVILTDDETQMERSDARVSRALERADAVMSALIAPDATSGGQMGGPGMGRRAGGALGGIILPGGGGMGMPRGGGMPGNMGGRTHSAGTSEIARDSGGDSMPVDDASSLETTLSRLRERYSIYFQLPPGVRKGDERTVSVSLSASVSRRYPYAEVRTRGTYIAPTDGPAGQDVAPEPTSISRSRSRGSDAPTLADSNSDLPVIKRRPAVSGPSQSGGPMVIPDKP